MPQSDVIPVARASPPSATQYQAIPATTLPVVLAVVPVARATDNMLSPPPTSSMALCGPERDLLVVKTRRAESMAVASAVIGVTGIIPIISQMASIWLGVRPSIDLASRPIAMTSRAPSRLAIATTEGSSRTMPLPGTKTIVFAVPSSMAMSEDTRPITRENIRRPTLASRSASHSKLATDRATAVAGPRSPFERKCMLRQIAPASNVLTPCRGKKIRRRRTTITSLQPLVVCQGLAANCQYQLGRDWYSLGPSQNFGGENDSNAMPEMTSGRVCLGCTTCRAGPALAGSWSSWLHRLGCGR